MDPVRGLIHLGLKTTETTLDRALEVVRLVDTLLVAGAVPPVREQSDDAHAWPAEEEGDLDALSTALRERSALDEVSTVPVAPAKKATAKPTTAKAPATKAPAKKAQARSTTAKKSTARKSSAKKAPAKKATAGSATTKTPAKKAATKKAAPRKTTAKKAASSQPASPAPQTLAVLPDA